MKHGDYELIATNYPHPDITTGQHTNGPAPIWVRYRDEPWLQTDIRHMHLVRAAIDHYGYAFIEKLRKEQES